MHDPEKSDSGRVAAKPTNKAGRATVTIPSSRMPTLSHFWIRRMMRLSPTLCSRKRTNQFWLTAPKKFWMSASSIQFTFRILLGFTFICGKSRQGSFQLHRKTRRDRMRAKLKDIKAELRRRMHQPIPTQGLWLKQVVTGHFAYYAVPTNSRALSAFRHYVTDLWRRTLRRRSQKDGFTWERMTKLVEVWLPQPRILHPWPDVRFDVKHPR